MNSPALPVLLPLPWLDPLPLLAHLLAPDPGLTQGEDPWETADTGLCVQEACSLCHTRLPPGVMGADGADGVSTQPLSSKALSSLQPRGLGPGQAGGLSPMGHRDTSCLQPRLQPQPSSPTSTQQLL